MIEAEILKKYRRVAVVGASANPERPSYQVASYLIEHGYDVVPVNPGAREILGRVAYADLSAIPGGVEVVDIFRRPEYVPQVVDDAIAAGAKAVWMQLGVVHEAAAERARASGLEVVMDRCTKVEHMRLQSVPPAGEGARS